MSSKGTRFENIRTIETAVTFFLEIISKADHQKSFETLID